MQLHMRKVCLTQCMAMLITSRKGQLVMPSCGSQGHHGRQDSWHGDRGCGIGWRERHAPANAYHASFKFQSCATITEMMSYKHAERICRDAAWQEKVCVNQRMARVDKI